MSEGTVDLQPFFTDTVLKKEATVFMAGPFFPPHPQGPADLTDIAGINQTFEGRLKPDGALRDGATAACWSPWIVAKEMHTILDVGK